MLSTGSGSVLVVWAVGTALVRDLVKLLVYTPGSAQSYLLGVRRRASSGLLSSGNKKCGGIQCEIAGEVFWTLEPLLKAPALPGKAKTSWLGGPERVMAEVGARH